MVSSVKYSHFLSGKAFINMFSDTTKSYEHIKGIQNENTGEASIWEEQKEMNSHSYFGKG